MSEDNVSSQAETDLLRAAWEVRAGVVPGVAMPELTKRWLLTSETFYQEDHMSAEEFKAKFPDGRSTYAQYRDEAYDYAKSLNDPRTLNWVEVSWIWY